MGSTSATGRPLDRRGSALRRFHEDEAGSMMAVMLVVLVFLLMLLALIVRQAAGLVAKAEGMEVTDRAARAIGDHRAEAINRVIDLNHRSGERLAWAVVAASVSGRRADESDLGVGEADEAVGLDREIESLAASILIQGGSAPAAEELAGRVETGNATGLGKVELKRALVADYRRRLASGRVSDVGEEGVILDEWRALGRVEDDARSAVAAQDHLLVEVVPGLLGRAGAIADGFAEEQAATIDGLERALGRGVGVEPAAMRLPLEAEPAARGGRSDEGRLARSQLVASAWPWVLHHRRGVLRRLAPLARSRAAEFYREATAAMLPRLAAEVYRGGARPMLVLVESDPSRKGSEPWRDDSRRAARRFAGLVVTLSRPLPSYPPRLLPDQHPAGRLGHSQVLIHPAGPGRPLPWDTLAWEGVAPTFPDEAEQVGPPRSKPSWVARLTPVTRLNEAAATLPEPFRPLAERAAPAPRCLQTH